MRLFIIRHGEAAVAGRDCQRPLTAAGRSQARALGLQLLAEDPQLLLYSPKLRAHETAEQILGSCQACDSAEAVELMPPGTLADIGELVEAAAAQGISRIALVSHLPMVAELAAWLITGDRSDFRLPGFPPAAVVAIDLEIFAAGSGQLAWHACPPDFRRLKH